MQENDIKLSFMTEKKEGHGEDAPPLLFIKEEFYAVGVFDGMGGAGAATCDSEYGEGYTKAYVSSRIVRDTVENLLEEQAEKDDWLEVLKMRILQRLKLEQEKFPSKTKSMLRSKMVREYPTTMAIVMMQPSDKNLLIDSYWAGDSHCYLWTSQGFYQISKDDLEENNDPMENLNNDAPISNCICADRDFTINHIHVELPKEPVVILCATDGCFGYLPTPMHFEDVLKRNLKNAQNVKDWEKKIMRDILSVTGDDTSLSLIAYGYDSFYSLKKEQKGNSNILKDVRQLEASIAELKKQLEMKIEHYESRKKKNWDLYKQEYMKYLK